MRALVIYYSRKKHCQRVAEKIAKDLNAEIIKIEAQEPYRGILTSAVRTFKEQHTHTNVVSRNKKISLKNYNPIIIVFPVLYSSVPKVVIDYLNKLKIKGKNVVIYTRSNGIGNESALKQIKRIMPRNLYVLPFHQYSSKASDFDAWRRRLTQIFTKEE